MGFKVELAGRPAAQVEKGHKGLRSNRREGGAWSPGRDMLGGWESKEGKRGLVTWGLESREPALWAGHTRLLAETWRPGGEGTVEAASQGAFRDRQRGAAGSPGGGICWFPLVRLEGEEGEDVLTRLMG